MSTAWVLFALLCPPVVAMVAGLTLSSRAVHPLVTIGLNTLSPGAGLAAAGRTTLESALGVLMAQASLFIVGTMGSMGYYLPIMVVGGLWASIYTPFSPLELGAGRDPAGPGPVMHPGPLDPPVPKTAAVSPPAPKSSSGDAPNDESGACYAVNVRCTECGAEVAVPVLHHMAHCTFCGSNHLVVGHEDTLYLTIPERASTEAELREALLDHYRYQHYVKLFQVSIPIIQAGAAEASPSGALVTRPEYEAAAAAAEVAVAKKADAYRARLAGSLHIGNTTRFYSPYRHGMGTLYQATFGRRKEDQEKHLSFVIGTVEASAPATSALTLPEMGKLTYLKALRPAVDCDEDAKSLPLDLDEEVLERAFGNLDRKQLDRTVNTIRLGSRFNRDVMAVVWRPWWIVEVNGPGIHETLLVDGGSGSVAGAAPTFDPELLDMLPESARDPGLGLHFIPMECPTCGHEFAFSSDEVLHFCHNCHRVCRVDGHRKHEVDYSRTDVLDGELDLVPFWLFPLRIRTTGDEVITDLAHLKDGIDGTFDQIGDDAPMRQHGLFVPAIRCINARLMGQAFNRLFLHTIRTRFSIAHERYHLDEQPRPWSVHMDETEARELAPLYLSNAFSRRDLARVNVKQVTDWLFEATQEKAGRLVYLPIPRAVTEPFRRYVGRFRGQALRKATKGA